MAKTRLQEDTGTAPGDGSDVASLTARARYLQMLRGTFFAVVAASMVFTPDLLGSFAVELAAFTVGYLVVSMVVERLRRQSQNPDRAWIAGMLLGDGVFLACVMYTTGGPESPLRFLVYLHVLVVTLLASHRMGLKIALWHSLLALSILFLPQVVDPFGTSGSLLPALDSVSTRLSLYNVAALWLVAAGTAVCSALNERDLRRAKVDLQALAEMASAFEDESSPEGVAQTLLDKIVGTFGFRRGIVLAALEGKAVLLATHGETGDASRVAFDPVAHQAWDGHASVLLAELAERNPHLRSLLPDARNVAVVPMFADGHPLGIVALEAHQDVATVEPRIVRMVEQFAAHGALAIRNAGLLQQVQKLAAVDPLTGVANRRTFESALLREVNRAERTGEELSLVMLDLDHFKQVNDTLGHQAGDDVLRRVAAALFDSSRDFDTVSRYGGEEFAIILPACPQAHAFAVAERFRRVVSNIPDIPSITGSAGVATFPRHAGDAKGLVRAADDALYLSKRLGRDRLTVSPTTARPPAPQPEGEDLVINLPGI